MKLGQLIGLPWFFIGVISALISGAIGLGFYQVGLFIATSYPTLWILPVLSNIFAFINVLIALLGVLYAVIGLVVFLYTTFTKIK